MSITTIIIILVIYLIGIPIFHFIFCYQEAKPDRNGGYKIDKDDSAGIIAASCLWPIMLIFNAFILPFTTTKKLALKLKNAKNPKKVNLNYNN